MAGLIYNFQDSPQYQKMLQRISTMRPEQRAILNSAAVDEKFGNEAMRSHLQGLINAAELKNKRTSLDISLTGSNERYNIAKEGMEFENKQNRMANIIGAAGVPLNAYLGYKQMKRDETEIGEVKKLREQLGQFMAAKAGSVS